ncbi:PREDICTED: uncharacterized protein LOC109584226 [Amphimedon queenslandica]|uniref:Uncharacterized protein n=1 Tax=Amphimedon queenslandica TaxID=400682 RepID=A0AAN0JF89_AMPQE|nr:PREDICTED: uncharacterized protein LOC109584226 [Amphimedon queenslandica]|eukprot:XP_019855451.1 PREDICTED: uncharacterized protein LOC109584226 [Amphimedon queenslandica]
MVRFLRYFCSIVAVICAVSFASGQGGCSIGHVYNPETQRHISNIPTGWYLNLDSPLSCSGRLSTLLVRFYQSLNSGHYCIPWAFWKPLENDTYKRVPNSDGSYYQYFDEADDDSKYIMHVSIYLVHAYL